ncbi:hypothetical protein D9619_000082 [Psilocybe cf. subviscida]|uniref:Nephrocystin 3-like N-terminal domain-containing protein n=1 Tax=Psilocybe cf. subviscida TaxID=2480587 RepID=A0A8H5BFY3_9AGAR|nr:hypothetical protein D9619_000082 [Psilocybe cf. subviscida]
MSSYGDPTGCMEGTRIKVLKDLDAWASDANGSPVYWMLGMAGIGKSTIAHTFCQMLEAQNMLSGSFFASRASEKTRNARLIIPVIAHALARSSPPIKFKVAQAIENDSTLAEPTYSNLPEQFKQLLCVPTAGIVDRPYKVVVIDAVDECENLDIVASFIKVVLQSASKLPFKVFISSREEQKIWNAFNSGDNKVENFRLHDIEKDVVQEDIRQYLKTSLASIRNENFHGSQAAALWPSQSEIENLVIRCGTLFIYAATAIRYIAEGSGNYCKSRLSEMAQQGLDMACKGKRSYEVTHMREIMSIIVFLQHPLPIQAIASLSGMDALSELSSLTSVIHIPAMKEATVAPFHASFPDFVTNSARCSPDRFLGKNSSFLALDAFESQQLLALRCLQLMNQSLKYNICGIPEELIVSHRERTNSPENAGKIPTAVKYSCLFWAAHLAKVTAIDQELAETFHDFLHGHLLHWIECLSILGELETGLKSLKGIIPILSGSGHPDLSLVKDTCLCLQMNFDAIQNHSMEIYQSALVWIPKKSLLRRTYHAQIPNVPSVGCGLPDLWGATELVIQAHSRVYSVAWSPNGSQIISGSDDGTVQIWNAVTGKLEAKLQGHRGSVNSVAFSQNGSQIVSGSDDNTVRIWNTLTGEAEAELQGHTGYVKSVAFSQDGSQVVSGSFDKTVRIWNAVTGKVEAELQGHTASVNSVAFSLDGSQVVSGSYDNTVRIWNAVTGKVEAELQGHTDWVNSVAFSQDGSQVVSGSADNTVQIWNAVTGKVEAELQGHKAPVNSVAFSQDGSQVVSGSVG